MRRECAWVEVSHDEKGIIWNKAISPFDVHLVDLRTKDKEQSTKETYEKLMNAGLEVLWDDRDVSAGEKFADSDLIGIPVRLVVSEKTGDKIEFKKRTGEKTELLASDALLSMLTK